MAGRPNALPSLIGILGVILAGWLFWISKSVVELQSQVAVMKFSLKISERKAKEKPGQLYEAFPYIVPPKAVIDSLTKEK